MDPRNSGRAIAITFFTVLVTGDFLGAAASRADDVRPAALADEDLAAFDRSVGHAASPPTSAAGERFGAQAAQEARKLKDAPAGARPGVGKWAREERAAADRGAESGTPGSVRQTAARESAPGASGTAGPGRALGKGKGKGPK